MEQLKSAQIATDKTNELSWHLSRVISDGIAALKLSARELGAKTNVSYTVIYDLIKRGIIPKVDTLLKLAEGLDLDVNIISNEESLSITISNKNHITNKISPTNNLRKALYYAGIKNIEDIEDIENFIKYIKFKRR